MAISASDVERALNVPLDKRETTRSPGDIESVSMTPSASRSPIPWYSLSASRLRERDDCDGRLQGERVAAGRRNAAPVQRRAQPVSPNRPVDVLQVAIAEILDVGIEGVAEEVAELGGRNGLTGFRRGADPGCQVDADAVDVRHPVEDLCGVQPGPKAEPLPIGQRRAPSGHPAVHLGRSADRFPQS